MRGVGYNESNTIDIGRLDEQNRDLRLDLPDSSIYHSLYYRENDLIDNRLNQKSEEYTQIRLGKSDCATMEQNDFPQDYENFESEMLDELASSS